MDVEEQKARARVLRELGPLAEVWESYRNLRKVLEPSRAVILNLRYRLYSTLNPTSMIPIRR